MKKNELLRAIKLGILDYKIKTKETKLSKYWPILSIYFTAISISIIYTILLGKNDDIYSLNVIIGYIIWSYLVNVSSELCYTYSKYKHIIMRSDNTLIFNIVRDQTRITIGFLYCILISLLFIRFADKFNIWTIPEVLLIVIITIIYGLILGTISAVVNMRYKDYSQILNAIIQGVFFITPIVWIDNPITAKYRIFELSPFFALFSETRSLLLVNEFTLYSLNITLSIVIGGVIAYILYVSIEHK